MGVTTLKRGPTLPDEVLLLAVDLEHRGYRLERKDDDGLVVMRGAETVPPLSSQDRENVKRWKAHLLAIVDYSDGKRVPK